MCLAEQGCSHRMEHQHVQSALQDITRLVVETPTVTNVCHIPIRLREASRRRPARATLATRALRALMAKLAQVVTLANTKLHLELPIASHAEWANIPRQLVLHRLPNV